jgi:hypothetical protein
MERIGNLRARGSTGKIRKSLSSAAENSLTTTAKVFSKDFTAKEYKLWTGILSDYSDTAVEWAFENWQRSGKFFPKPAELLELLHTFSSSSENQVKLCGICKDGWVITNPDAKPSDHIMRRCECMQAAINESKIPVRASDKARHGRGYGANDVLWLWKSRQTSGTRWAAADWNAALDHLDGLRAGGAPEWRR